MANGFKSKKAVTKASHLCLRPTPAALFLRRILVGANPRIRGEMAEKARMRDSRSRAEMEDGNMFLICLFALFLE